MLWTASGSATEPEGFCTESTGAAYLYTFTPPSLVSAGLIYNESQISGVNVFLPAHQQEELCEKMLILIMKALNLSSDFTFYVGERG